MVIDSSMLASAVVEKTLQAYGMAFQQQPWHWRCCRAICGCAL
jgi:hypothetical protein